MLLINACLATLQTNDSFGLIEDGAVVIEGETITWVGRHEDLPREFAGMPAKDCSGRLVTPSLIDCHTHVVFGGNRALEFEMRLNGASYEELARAGGGIISTVEATRNASESALLEDALVRVDAMIAEGITTLEIKSGYGLNPETELKMLRVARQISNERPVDVCTSFLGAHAIPKEFASNPEAYIREVCIPTLQKAHAEGLVDAVDGFCENIAFQPDHIALLFDEAAKIGMPVKLHAEQLTNSGGTRLAAKYNALSADHLEYATADDAAAMAAAEMTAVLLPGAFYTLRETQLPPIEPFRQHHVPMAIATDCNPGSSPMASLILAMNFACTLFRMTPLEAWLGVTTHAAKALGITNRGRIASGMRADLCIWDLQHPSELPYRIGFNPLHTRIYRGEA